MGSVLRKKKDDLLRLFDGKNGEWLGRIITIKRQDCTVELQERLRAHKDLPPLTLMFALVKNDVTKRIIRMGTELGVTHFMPIITQRTNTHRINHERLYTISIEAAEQCERLDIPEIFRVRSLKESLDSWPPQEIIYLALERNKQTYSFPTGTKGKGHVILTGPEGGFTQQERETLLKMPQIYPFSLGYEILRADTAAIASLSLLKYSS